MTARVERARLAVRKVLRDARDKNKWRKIIAFRLWMPVALQVLRLHRAVDRARRELVLVELHLGAAHARAAIAAQRCEHVVLRRFEPGPHRCGQVGSFFFELLPSRHALMIDLLP